MPPAVGDEILCPCGQWVAIERGINALIPEKGHRYHFYSEAHVIRKSGQFPGDNGMRTHHIGPMDKTRKAMDKAA